MFADYDSSVEKKTELLYFVATNIKMVYLFIIFYFHSTFFYYDEYIEAILKMSTKIDISLKDFKSSNLGTC